jgi:monoamine oxidase
VLEGANIKLSSVVSDIMGVSSRDMLHAIADGEDDPEKLANFARRTMKRKKDELELALHGYVIPHQRLMIKTILTHIDLLSEQITVLDQEVVTRVVPFSDDVERLDSIPGIATRMAEQILAEIGTNIKKQFPVLRIYAHVLDLCLGITKVQEKEKLLNLKTETNI